MPVPRHAIVVVMSLGKLPMLVHALHILVRQVRLGGAVFTLGLETPRGLIKGFYWWRACGF